MENEIQPSIPPAQPTPTAPPTVPQSANRPKTLLFSLLGLVIVAGSLFVGVHIGKNQASNQQSLAIPSQTPVSPTTEPTAVPTSNLQTLTSDQFGFTLKFPPDWVHYKNGNNTILKLPYIRSLSAKNETLAKADGCAIHFGFGGGSGPSEDIRSQTVSIGSLTFTKKVWLIDAKPVFASYLSDEVSPATKKFELLFTWISDTNSDLCQKEIDQILSTLEFSN